MVIAMDLKSITPQVFWVQIPAPANLIIIIYYIILYLNVLLQITMNIKKSQKKEVFNNIEKFIINHYLYFIMVFFLYLPLKYILDNFFKIPIEIEAYGFIFTIIVLICTILQNSAIQGKIKLRDEELRDKLKIVIFRALEETYLQIIREFKNFINWEEKNFYKNTIIDLDSSLFENINYYNCDSFNNNSSIKSLLKIIVLIKNYNKENHLFLKNLNGYFNNLSRINAINNRKYIIQLTDIIILINKINDNENNELLNLSDEELNKNSLIINKANKNKIFSDNFLKKLSS